MIAKIDANKWRVNNFDKKYLVVNTNTFAYIIMR